MDYTCVCIEGYEMHVEEDGEKACGNVDDCDGHMCGEGGVCVDLIQEHECQCHEGWEQVVQNGVRTCERVECGSAPQIDHVMASIEDPATSSGIYPWTRAKADFGETIEYVCAHGYTTDGQLGSPHSFSILCQADGTYTDASLCLPISCGEPDIVGDASPSSLAHAVFGQTVDYVCPSGFAPETFTRTCLENGQFSAPIACEPNPDVPVVCEKPAAPETWVWINEAALTSHTPAFLRCADGYQSAQSNANQQFEITCDTDGNPSPMPEACVDELHTISGHFRSAVDLSVISEATWVIAGQTLTLDGNSRFSIDLPAGQHTYQLSAEGFITIEAGSMTVAGSTSEGDLFMSPLMDAGGWRVVLEWGAEPTDLDSHLIFNGESDNQLWGCPEMYYRNSHATCRDVEASLDVDDTNGFGPETTTLSNTNHCEPSSWRDGTCKWIYKVFNYIGHWGSPHGWVSSQAIVTLYNGEALVETFSVVDQLNGVEGQGYTAGDGVYGISKERDDYFWSVFSVDYLGNVEPCTTATCA